MKLAYRNQRNAEIISRFWNKPLDKPEWFEVKAQAENEAEILIYDVIGWPFIPAEDFVNRLTDFGAMDLTIRINSPGGDVFDALAMYNAMRSYKGKITVRIESLAASSASIIALAGREIQAYKNAMMMIHEPWTIAVGNQYDFVDIADLLGKIGGNLLDIYADNSNIGKRTIKEMMKDETWFTAREMKEKGLINTIIEGDGVKAKFDLSIFSRTPDNFEPEDGGKQLSPREIERALRDAGASRNFAKAVAVRGSEKPKAIEKPTANQWDAEIADKVKSLTIQMYGGYKNV